MQYLILHSFLIPKNRQNESGLYNIDFESPTTQKKNSNFFFVQIDNSWYRRGFFSNNTPEPISLPSKDIPLLTNKCQL